MSKNKSSWRLPAQTLFGILALILILAIIGLVVINNQNRLKSLQSYAKAGSFKIQPASIIIVSGGNPAAVNLINGSGPYTVSSLNAALVNASINSQNQLNINAQAGIKSAKTTISVQDSGNPPVIKSLNVIILPQISSGGHGIDCIIGNSDCIGDISGQIEHCEDMTVTDGTYNANRCDVVDDSGTVVGEQMTASVTAATRVTLSAGGSQTRSFNANHGVIKVKLGASPHSLTITGYNSHNTTIFNKTITYSP